MNGPSSDLAPAGFFHVFPVRHDACDFQTFEAYVTTKFETTFVGEVEVRCPACGQLFRSNVTSTKCAVDRPDHLPQARIIL